MYSDLFDKIYANELNFVRRLGLGSDSVREAPVMGNLDSLYAQVSAFYNYWLGFAMVMDFCWVEEENKKLRKKARREYNNCA